jgi:hypothetical protein
MKPRDWIDLGGSKITLTRELIEECRTERGGFTKATIEAFGLEWPPRRGWPRRLIGTDIDHSKYNQAQQGRFEKV